MRTLITLSMGVPATVYPTLTVDRQEWEEALSNADKGIETPLQGVIGGHGCRGGTIPTSIDTVTVTKRIAERYCSAVSESWGDVTLSER